MRPGCVRACDACACVRARRRAPPARRAACSQQRRRLRRIAAHDEAIGSGALLVSLEPTSPRHIHVRACEVSGKGSLRASTFSTAAEQRQAARARCRGGGRDWPQPSCHDAVRLATRVVFGVARVRTGAATALVVVRPRSPKLLVFRSYRLLRQRLPRTTSRSAAGCLAAASWLLAAALAAGAALCQPPELHPHIWLLSRNQRDKRCRRRRCGGSSCCC